MDECFLFSVDSYLVVLFTMLLSLQKAFVAWLSGIGIPNIRSLNRRCSMASTHTQRAMNSLENALDSTVCCLLLCHRIGDQFMNMTHPACDLRVFLLAACEASTNAVVCTGRPRGLGISNGGCSSASWHCS